MAVRIETQAEPIPGYKLVERLGGGGFGEVWKAVAPGGLLKAIKFVYGDLQTADEDGQRAEQELKAMSRVKTVRHPYILSLERFDIIDGQLMIVMELADRNLWDRFRECRSQGLPGIPREELLRYMEETAEALDLMNIQYQLQHLDIKPQNIFLVHNHVKVADFGLVKDLEGMAASVTGGVTPVYAAPETFDGWVSRFCDQYSLAIMYQELLTGQRPFAGSNVRQLIVQHLQGTPNLEPLPPGDREAVGRSLAKSPDSRFPSCQLFVNALRAATVRDGAAGPTAAGASAGPIAAPADGEQVRTPGGDSPAHEGEGKERELLPPSAVRPVWLARDHVAKAEEQPAPRPRIPRIEGDGILLPALVLGLGQGGLSVLQRLREVLAEHVGAPDLLPSLRSLYIDTDPEAVRAGTTPRIGAALTPEEILLVRLNRPSHYLRSREGRSHIDAWFNPKMLYRIPRNLITTGMRALGRLAFCDNYRLINRKLRAELEPFASRDILTATDVQQSLGVRTNQPRVYVVASLAGGTGSGIFLDVAYVVRALLNELGFDAPEVVGIFLLPAVDRNPSRTLALGNTFAALTELHHFSIAGTTFTARYGEKEGRLSNSEPPFNQCFLLTVPESPDGSAQDEVTGRVASFLYRDLCTPLGRTADSTRATLPTLGQPAQQPDCHTFALYRFSWPRRALCQRVARYLCKQIVQRWMSKDSAPVREPVQAWVQEQWTKEELAAECLIARLQTACEQSLGRLPEATFAAILEPLGHVVNGPPEPAVAALKEALAQVEELVGRPEAGSGNRPIPVKECLDQAAETLVAAWGQKMAELAVRLIEQPEYRLAGAEEALRQFVATIEKVLQHYEPLAKELSARVIDSHGRIMALLTNSADLAAGGRRAATLVTNLLDLLRLFPKWRYQSLVLYRVAATYVSLRGYLSDQLRDINYCRARLSELQRAFENPNPPGAPRGEHGPGRNFFPAGCRKLEEAIQAFLASVTPQDLQDLDGRIQAVISQQFTALVYVCLSSNNQIKNLEVAMQQEAESFADATVGRASVAEMFLAHYSQEEEVFRAIVEAYGEAAPENVGSGGAGAPEFSILAVPPGPAGERFAELSRQVLEQAELVMTTSPDDIVFYREAPHLVLAELEQLGPVAFEAYQQMTSLEHFTPHSRTDITAWLAASE